MNTETKPYTHICSIAKTIYGFITPIIGLWILASTIWTFVSISEKGLLDRSEQAAVFKEQCVSQSGRVRHESLLFGVDIYCLEQDGNESLFIYDSKHIPFVSTLIDNMFFGIFNLNAK